MTQVYGKASEELRAAPWEQAGSLSTGRCRAARSPFRVPFLAQDVAPSVWSRWAGLGTQTTALSLFFFLFRVKLNICSACSGCHQTVKARAGLGYLSCSGVLQLRFLPTDLIWAQRRFAHEIKNSYLPQKSALRRPWAACIGWSSYSFTWVIVLRDEER